MIIEKKKAYARCLLKFYLIIGCLWSFIYFNASRLVWFMVSLLPFFSFAYGVLRLILSLLCVSKNIKKIILNLKNEIFYFFS